MTLRIPGCTYRLQLTKASIFATRRRVVDYLDALGVTDVYASPFLVARPGSTHGYDVIDHTRSTPSSAATAISTRCAAACSSAAWASPRRRAQPHGHRHADNRWWIDVLENGPSSPYAAFFDIDWHPPKAELHEQGAAAGARRPVRPRAREPASSRSSSTAGAFFVRYWRAALPDRRRGTILPLLEPTWRDLRRSHPAPSTPDVLEIESIVTATRRTCPPRWDDRARAGRASACARRRSSSAGCRARARQRRRSRRASSEPAPDQRRAGRSAQLRPPRRAARRPGLSAGHWRVAAEEINYRRFFDINDLAAIRVEDAQRLRRRARPGRSSCCGEGKVTGLRIDHLDGLLDPPGYLEDLQQACAPARDAVRRATRRRGTPRRAPTQRCDLRGRREDPRRRRARCPRAGRCTARPATSS